MPPAHWYEQCLAGFQYYANRICIFEEREPRVIWVGYIDRTVDAVIIIDITCPQWINKREPLGAYDLHY